MHSGHSNRVSSSPLTDAQCRPGRHHQSTARGPYLGGWFPEWLRADVRITEHGRRSDESIDLRYRGLIRIQSNLRSSSRHHSY